jgi:multidrug efflux pump subunit AcrB
MGLTLEDIRPAIVTATTDSPKGFLNTAETGFTIAANDQIIDAEIFNDVILAYRNGAPIRVRDVGRALAEASNRNLAGYQNNELGIILNVFKQAGANVISARRHGPQKLSRCGHRLRQQAACASSRSRR